MKSVFDANLSEEMETAYAAAILSPDAFVAIDYDYRFLFVNPVAEKFYGKTKHELVGNRVPDIFPQQWNFGPFKAVQKNVAVRTHFEMTYHSPFANRWVLLTGRPYEIYYAFTYKVIDQKTALNEELRKLVNKNK